MISQMDFELGLVPEMTAVERAFLAYHEANDGVYRLFVAYTLTAIREGHATYSAKAIFERIRWETSVKAKKMGLHDKEPKPFRLPNQFTPFYARLFMRDHPEHKGVFSLRASAADDSVTLNPNN